MEKHNYALLDEQSTKESSLIAHMNKVSQQIKSWPQWQQDLLAAKLKSSCREHG